MAALRTSTSGLSAEQQDMALKRLLRQSWQVQRHFLVTKNKLVLVLVPTI